MSIRTRMLMLLMALVLSHAPADCLWDSGPQPDGTVFRLYGSTDLQTWYLIAEVPAEAGKTEYRVARPTNGQREFYKLAAVHDGWVAWCGGKMERDE